jgi:two-component system, chemotaxis family, protein-glutamate methylesterase/glutaminase
MPGHDIIAIGASAGGVHALSQVIGGLPPELPAAVFAVLHLGQGHESALPSILRRAGALPVKHPEATEAIRRGWVYAAPPDRHMVLSDSSVRLVQGPRENGYRPAIDVLFRSAARAYGRRVVGVVLTGNLDDGTAGLAAIKSAGGLALVQDPAGADFPSMPLSAIENVEVDQVVPLERMAETLVTLVGEPAEEVPASSILALEEDLGEPGSLYGAPSGFTCPDCGGGLWELAEGGLLRYRCRTGHAFSPESLLGGQTTSREAAMWAAVRSLEEMADLARRLESRMHERGLHYAERRYGTRASEAERHAAVLRELLSTMQPEAVE